MNHQIYPPGSIDFGSKDSVNEFHRFFEAWNNAPEPSLKVDLLVDVINEARECVARAYCFNCMAFSMLYTFIQKKMSGNITLADLIRDHEFTHEELAAEENILQYFRQNIGRNYRSAQKAIKVGDLLLKWIQHPKYGGKDKKFDAPHMNTSTYNAIANVAGVTDRLALLDKVVNGEEDSKKLVSRYSGTKKKYLSAAEKKMLIDDKEEELKVLVRKVNNYINDHILIYCDSDGTTWPGGEIKIYRGK